MVEAPGIELDERELFGLLGPNGAGARPLVRILTGLLPLISGRASMQGVGAQHDPDGVRRRLGVVPETQTSDLD